MPPASLLLLVLHQRPARFARLRLPARIKGNLGLAVVAFGRERARVCRPGLVLGAAGECRPVVAEPTRQGPVVTVAEHETNLGPGHGVGALEPAEHAEPGGHGKQCSGAERSVSPE